MAMPVLLLVMKKTGHRLSIFGTRLGEYGGLHDNLDSLPDLMATRGISWSAVAHMQPGYELEWQLSRQNMQRENFSDSNFLTESPLQETMTDVGWARLTHYDGTDHQWQLKAYWSGSNVETDYSACTLTFAFDPALSALYRTNPGLAETLAYGLLPYRSGSDATRASLAGLYQVLAAGVLSAGEVTALLASQGVSQQVSSDDLILVQQAAGRLVQASGYEEYTCGSGNVDLYEQRIDVEFQDTRTWNAHWRSVQGISWRSDSVDSQTYFSGEVRQDTWAGFFNVEYRPGDHWLLFSGLMAEYEEGVGMHYSPRIAATYLISDNHSIRSQYSYSYRSPDLAERYLNATATLHNMSSNYLGLGSASLFLQARAEAWDGELTDEEIRTWELGYFGNMLDSRLTIDIKLYREILSSLIGSTVSLLDSDLDNGGAITFTGAEFQTSLKTGPRQQLWLVGMIQDRDANDNAQSDLTLGAERSLRAIWSHQGLQFDQAIGFQMDQASGSSVELRTREPYRQRRVMGRVGMHLGRTGLLAIQADYDADAGASQFERNGRWSSFIDWRYRW